MTQQEALDELTQRFDARLNGLHFQAMGRREPSAIPAETGGALARIAVEWAREHGVSFD